MGKRIPDSYAQSILGCETGQSCYREQQRGLGRCLGCFQGGLKHFFAARGMQGEHVNAKAAGGTNRPCDGVWNIVKLQIEENALT